MYKQDIKEKVKERYGKIALLGNVDSCCMPGECCQVDDDNNKNDHNTFASLYNLQKSLDTTQMN